MIQKIHTHIQNKHTDNSANIQKKSININHELVKEEKKKKEQIYGHQYIFKKALILKKKQKKNEKLQNALLS